MNKLLAAVVVTGALAAFTLWWMKKGSSGSGSSAPEFDGALLA